jgi:hypothetical protein
MGSLLSSRSESPSGIKSESFSDSMSLGMAGLDEGMSKGYESGMCT